MKKLYYLFVFCLSLLPLNAEAADAYGEYNPGTVISNGSYTANFFTIDEEAAAGTLSGDYLPAVGHCHEATTIAQLCIRGGVRAGTPTRLQISLQGVNGSGLPDGAIKTSVSSVFTPPATNAWDGLVKCTGDAGFPALGATYACAQGEAISIVVEDDPATSDVVSSANTLTITSHWTNAYFDSAWTYSYRHDHAAGVPTNTRVLGVPSLFYRSATKAYWYPIQTGSSVTYSDATNPDERGMHFKRACTEVFTYTAPGVWWWGKGPVTGSTVDLTLYNGTAAVPVAIDGPDQTDTDLQISAAANSQHLLLFKGTLPTLSCGVDYWVTARAGTGAAISVGDLSVATANDLSAFPGGKEFYAATRDGAAGAITEIITTRPHMSLIINDRTLASVAAAPTSNPFNEGFNP